jgi:uncharacterized protein (DUF2236 family)
MASLYQPDSVTWRVNRESALLLAAGRSLLMQLAHPAVAAGVADHSDFRRRPLARLLRTLQLSLALSFGTAEETQEAARAINRVHRRIHGPGYRATDPVLLLWVHATLIDSALTAYSTFVQPLEVAEREAYFEEAKRVGPLLGLAETAYPPHLAAFEDYLRSMLEGPELVVDARARALAAAVLHPLRLVPGVAWFPFQAVTAGLLPQRLREAYGLPWALPERAFFAALARGLPPLLPLLPTPLRTMPQAQARVAASRDHPHRQEAREWLSRARRKRRGTAT